MDSYVIIYKYTKHGIYSIKGTLPVNSLYENSNH